jgi:hypothetical protein
MTSTEFPMDTAIAPVALSWPKDMPAQFALLRRALARGPATAQDVARALKGAPHGERMTEMLRTPVAFGEARLLGPDRYTT